MYNNYPVCATKVECDLLFNSINQIAPYILGFAIILLILSVTLSSSKNKSD